MKKPPPETSLKPQSEPSLRAGPAKTSLSAILTDNSSKQNTELQRALVAHGVTAEWVAAKLKENADALKPVTYLGQVTQWVPDTPTRVKALEQIERIRGDISEAETASAGVAIEISIDERRRIQVRAAARLGTWGQPYQEADEDIGPDEYPV